MIKDIIKNLKPSSTLLINEISNKLEREGKKYLNLALANLHSKYLKILLMNLKITHIKINIFQCKVLKI